VRVPPRSGIRCASLARRPAARRRPRACAAAATTRRRRGSRRADNGAAVPAGDAPAAAMRAVVRRADRACARGRRPGSVESMPSSMLSCRSSRHCRAPARAARGKISMSRSFRVGPGGRLVGRIRVPGDKSISHRALMLGAIAEGTTKVSGFLTGADAISTMNVFRALGVEIDGPHEARVVVHGVGLHGLRAPAAPLDCGNAGTAMRLLMGLLAGQRFESTLIGDESLSRRPMRRVAEPLQAMGARIETNDGLPPVRIRPSPGLRAIRYELPVASAQLKSALLLAGLYAQGETVVVEPAPTRDHTERMLRGFGVDVRSEGRVVAVRGGQTLRAAAVDVPADLSSAAFFLVGAPIAPGSDLTLEHVGLNRTRAGCLEILRRMGADIEILAAREAGGEPVADLRVRAAPLRGIDVPPELVPLAIDE